jgi:hypothetical protein
VKVNFFVQEQDHGGVDEPGGVANTRKKLHGLNHPVL